VLQRPGKGLFIPHLIGFLHIFLTAFGNALFAFLREVDVWGAKQSAGVRFMVGMLRYLRSQAGNVGIMLALGIFPIMMAVGVAVDMVQTNRTLTVLQSAADAAALSAAASGETDDAKLQVIVENYLTANGAAHVLDDIDDIDADLDKSKNVFAVNIRGKRKTSLMYLAGISSMELYAKAEVKLGAEGYEVVLVLDNTASMSQGGRMPALKVAASDLVDKLMEAKDFGAYVKLGVVPFASYVNIGISRRSEPWLDIPADKSETKYACWKTYPHATKSNCKQVPYINDGIDTGTTYEQCDWNYGLPEEVCGNTTVSETWSGCIGSRNDPLDESIGTVTTPYKGLMNTTCGSEIVELTDSESKLKDAIDGLVATGETYIPAGLLWGWHMVDSNEPLKKAKSQSAMNEIGGTKAIVLMTDGQNTLAPYAPHHWGGNGATDWAKGDAKTSTLCSNIKNDGVTIYTVSFMVTDTQSLDLMAQCASDSTKALTAENAAELAEAFKNIGSSLMAMRLSK
jgi:Flp pilus assembly protein TadG